MKPFTLVGVDSNAFCIIAYVQKAMKQAGFNRQQIDDYANNATQGDYNVFERLKEMFYHSWKNRRKVIFS